MVQGTKQDSGMGIGGALALIATAVIAGLMFQAANKGRTPTDKQDLEQVVISVVFRPQDRTNSPVHVIANVEDARVIDELATHSPANWTITVPRGAQVLVSAQQEIDDNLDCLIQVDGKTVDHNHRNTWGSVRCWHNRKG